MIPREQIFKFIDFAGRNGATCERIRFATKLPLRVVNKCVLELLKDGYLERAGIHSGAIIYTSRQLKLPTVTHDSNG